MGASACQHHTMAYRVSVSLVCTLAAATLLFEIQGSSIGWTRTDQTGSLKSEFKNGYQGNSIYPGGVVYTVGGYYPGITGYYPASAEGGHPGAAAEYPVASGEEGKISGAVPVDDEVEVFDVPQSNQEGYPGRGQPDGGYPSVYPNGVFPGLYPSGWYPGVYWSAG